MFPNCLKIYFIFILYINIQVKYGFTKENTPRSETVLSIIRVCKYNTCSCAEFGNMPRVTCKKKDDSVKNPSYNLKKSTIYEVNFTNIEYLHAGMFQGLVLHQLNVDSPNVTIDEKVLEGVVALRFFEVKRSRTKIVPDFRFVKDSIEWIKIESSGLMSLTGENLQNLVHVQGLSFSHNAIHFIDSTVFEGTEDVKWLDLSDNLLTYIPQNLFDRMKNLRTFKAERNELIHIFQLFSDAHPNNIHLKLNNIRDISFVLEPRLELMTNKRLYPEDIDYYNVDLDNEPFEILYDIETWDLSHNSINDSLKPIVPCYSSAGAISVKYMVRIKELNLSENKLRNLGSLFRCLKINKLDVTLNQIHYLTDKNFITNNIKTLDLQFNEIRSIDSDTFKPLRIYLKTLHLSFNSIRSLNGSVRYLSQLEILELSQNSIQSFASDEFAGLNSLSQLHLEDNNIKTIEQLRQLPFLEYLHIEDNYIELIKADQLPKTLRSLNLAGNPFKCNCQLLAFLLRIKGSSIETDIVPCSESDMDSNLYKRPYCPSICSCECTERENVSFIFANCSSKNLNFIPQFLRSNFAKMEVLTDFRPPLVIDQNAYPMFHIEDKLLGISLENNNLDSLEGAYFPPNLTQLYLANNKLGKMPESLFNNQQKLKQASLSGNPWKCDCNAVKFKKWLTYKKDNIHDIENVRCRTNGYVASFLDNRIIWNLDDFDLCPNDCFF